MWKVRASFSGYLLLFFSILLLFQRVFQVKERLEVKQGMLGFFYGIPGEWKGLIYAIWVFPILFLLVFLMILVKGFLLKNLQQKLIRQRKRWVFSSKLYLKLVLLSLVLTLLMVGVTWVEEQGIVQMGQLYLRFSVAFVAVCLTVVFSGLLLLRWELIKVFNVLLLYCFFSQILFRVVGNLKNNVLARGIFFPNYFMFKNVGKIPPPYLMLELAGLVCLSYVLFVVVVYFMDIYEEDKDD